MLSRPHLYSNLLKICGYGAARSNVTAATTPTSALVAAPSDVRQYHEVIGDVLCRSQVMGIDHLRDPRLNKGLAFTLAERHALGIHGLMPPRFKSQEEQLELVKIVVDRYTDPLNKFIYLEDLHDRNECLFFRFLSENIADTMPIVHTPTVGLACQRFGLIYRRPRGLFITINDRGHVFDVIKNWPEPNVRAIVVTDGESILGLGDLGANGMGVPVGKLELYVAIGGIKPHQCLAIQIDVGTNNMELIGDPLYIGLRQKRVTGPEYDDLIDELMLAIVRRYGRNTLIQFEDFDIQNAFKFLDKYNRTYCTFNADIQARSAVILAGINASLRITKKFLIDNTFLIVGSGEAAIGSADLIVKAMMFQGVSQEEARARIFMVDGDGLLTSSRKESLRPSHKAYYVKEREPIKDLEAIVSEVKPTVLIGAFSDAGIFTPKILRKMIEHNERPLIFAMSNPDKAECTAEQAYQNTDSRAIFVSGSRIPPVTIKGKINAPGYASSSYIYPGIVLAVLATGAHYIRDDMFQIAAHQLARHVTEEDLNRGSLYPPLSEIREVSMRIAESITKYVYGKGLATIYPEPRDKRKWLEDQMFNYNYQCQMPVNWTYPRMPFIKTRELAPTAVFEDL